MVLKSQLLLVEGVLEMIEDAPRLATQAVDGLDLH